MTLTKRQYIDTKSNAFEDRFKSHISDITDWLYGEEVLKDPGACKTRVFSALIVNNTYWPLDFPMSDVMDVFVPMFKTTKIYTENHKKIEYVVEAFNRTVKFNATAFAEAIFEKRKEFYA